MQGMGLPIGKEKKVYSFMEYYFGYSIKDAFQVHFFR